MIEEVRGNLLYADVDALVNTVNTVGVMGKGIALLFRQAYPENYKAYVRAVNDHQVVPGRMFVFATNALQPRYTINFPTKRHWRDKSRIEDIEAGLQDLRSIVEDLSISSLAIPALGCGNGGLDWAVVRPLIIALFEEIPNLQVLLYSPAYNVVI